MAMAQHTLPAGDHLSAADHRTGMASAPGILDRVLTTLRDRASLRRGRTRQAVAHDPEDPYTAYLGWSCGKGGAPRQPNLPLRYPWA